VRLNDQQTIYVRSMGKALRVTAMFTDEAEANRYMERNADEGVVAVFGPYVLLANLFDKGVRIPREGVDAAS
jgi:hypothetical protein